MMDDEAIHIPENMSSKKKKKWRGSVRCSVAVGQKQKIAGRRQWLAHLQQSILPFLRLIVLVRSFPISVSLPFQSMPAPA